MEGDHLQTHFLLNKSRRNFMAIIGNPTPGNDSITGDELPNFIDALAGNDIINGNGGNDTLIGGADNDTLIGGTGDDQLGGDNFGGAGNDSLSGGAGRDTLNGGLGVDTLVGGADNDTYAVGVSNTTIIEQANEGDDDIVNSSVSFTLSPNLERLTLVGTSNINGTGNAENNLILGNNANNSLSGLGGNDTISGQDGDDTLRGGLGDDTLFGGDGIDTVVVNASGSGANIVLTDTSVSGDGDDFIDGIENARLFVSQGNIDASAFTKGSVTLDGGFGRNNLLGSRGSDFLDGEGGIDTLSGGRGNDTLNGGRGADLLTGGPGSDRFLFDTFNPILSGEDSDRITDFTPGIDKIVLDKSIFTALASGPGSLLASDFQSGVFAPDVDSSSAKIVYSAGGTLTYNANGTALGASGIIASIDGAPNLSLSDFIVVA
jgi:Ca2+-binding RTX toxin-like protein